MKLIDSEVIAVRLRVTLEQLFEVSNQAVFLGLVHPHVASLTLQMSNRLYFCIDEVAQIIKEIDPRKIDTGCFPLEDTMLLEGYAEIRRGLLKSWQFIESRERAILQQAANRQAGTRIDQQGGRSNVE